MTADTAWRVTGFVLRVSSWFCLILIGTRAVFILIIKFPPGVNIFMHWIFNFCLFWIFALMVLVCWMSNPGGVVEYDMIFIARTVTL